MGSVKDRELPVMGKAVKGHRLPLKATPPVIGKETFEDGRWSTPVSAAFAEFKWKYQAPEFEMFGKDCKIRIPEESAYEIYKMKQRCNHRFLVTWLIRIL